MSSDKLIRSAQRISYAQFGEDLFLDVAFRRFGRNYKGFYVDVGAHHPFYKSNTLIFYQRGWSGINIDADPRALPAFKKNRSRDINLNLLVSSESGFRQFSVFPEGAFNSLQAADSSQRPFLSVFLELRSLDSILASALPPDRDFSFLSVDCEGHDLSVLESNDWFRWRPRYVVVEIHGLNLMEAKDNPVVEFLRSHRYQLCGYSAATAYFVDASR